MARFERSRERKSKKYSRDSSPQRGARSRRSFKDSPNDRRFAGREFNHNSRNRRDIEMTKVTCSSCGEEC